MAERRRLRTAGAHAACPSCAQRFPKRYPIRHYPDITHSRQAQYPVPDWDVAYAVTEGARGHQSAAARTRPRSSACCSRYTIGFLTYSEGCNDDVNKFVWSALGWNPDAKVIDILREYSRYFIGARYTDSFAQGLLALERNWRGPLADQRRRVHHARSSSRRWSARATPQVLANWRFQQALYRAYYDAYTRSRLLYETELEDARDGASCARARATGRAGGHDARRGDARPRDADQRVAADWRARIFELAEALFQSIRMQLSVPLLQGDLAWTAAPISTPSMCR